MKSSRLPTGQTETDHVLSISAFDLVPRDCVAWTSSLPFTPAHPECDKSTAVPKPLYTMQTRFSPTHTPKPTGLGFEWTECERQNASHACWPSSIPELECRVSVAFQICDSLNVKERLPQLDAHYGSSGHRETDNYVGIDPSVVE